MTNEEKAIEIGNKHSKAIKPVDKLFYSFFRECKDASLEMAEWKDKQFKEYLEKKCHSYAEQMCIWRDCAEVVHNIVVQTSLLNTIINELFKEE